MVFFGLLMVFSSSFIFAQERAGDGFFFIKKQFVLAGVGLLAMLGFCRVDYRVWQRYSYLILGASIVLLVAVLVPGIGARAGGAQRWLRFGWFGFQPSEIAHFAVLLFVARQLTKNEDRVETFSGGVSANFLIPLPAMALILLQPDFGTTVMIALTILALMQVGGVPYRYLFFLILVACLGVTSLIVLEPYRLSRFMAFLDPWADPGGKGFQIVQSLVGLHNGQWTGVGLGNGKSKLFFLPEAHNDFIFAVIGEELGWIGIISVVAAYLFFIYRGFRIAWNATFRFGDRFGMLLAAGITFTLGFQGLVNMAVVMGLLPTKGLTLPFISYGGTAMVMNLISVGILLSVSRGPQASHRKVR